MTDQAGFGYQTPIDSHDSYNAVLLVIRQQLSQFSVMTPVKIVKVTTDGGLAAAGTVDVQPLVSMLDGNLQSMDHGVLYKMSYMRLQGGTAAIVIDPKVGDIGFAIFSDRDTSIVRKTKKISQPGSLRQHSMSDGFYIGGILNAVPEKYVFFDQNELKIVDPLKINLTAPVIELNGAIAINGTVSGPGNVINLQATINMTGDLFQTGSQNVSGDVNAGGKSLDSHVHGGVQPGGGSTGPPT